MKITDEMITTIRNSKYSNPELEEEDIAERFGIEIETVLYILSDDYSNIPDTYEDRIGLCGMCGSAYNDDGLPEDCMGDCGVDDSQYYSFERGEGDPRELEF